MSSKAGYVYIMSNPTFRYLKIGNSLKPENRREQLSNPSGVPFPFVIELTKRFDNCVLAENILHRIFSDKRVNKSREFFDITLEEVQKKNT